MTEQHSGTERHPMNQRPPLLVRSYGDRKSLQDKKLPQPSFAARLAAPISRTYHAVSKGWWIWEFSAASVSVIATLSLINVLAQADKHPPPSWTIGGTEITLNTIVAAIGTIIRTSLLIVVAGGLNQGAWNWFASRTDGTHSSSRPLKDFETFSEAGANSWNCFKLLQRTRFRYIVSIGAVTMILLLAFDLFVQQTLSTSQQPTFKKLDSSNLTTSNIIARTLNFNLTGVDNTETLTNSTLNLFWESLVTGSLLKSQSSQPALNCPGAQCSWPTTPTVGICSECVDVAAHVNVTNLSVPTCQTDVTYSLPPLWPIPGQESPASVPAVDCGDLNRTQWILYSEAMPRIGRYANNNFSQYHNTTFLAMYSLGSMFRSTQSSKASVVAYRCSLSFCVQGHAAQSTAGNAVQTVATTPSFTSELINDADSGFDEDGVPKFQWRFTNIPSALNVQDSDTFMIHSGLIWMLNFHLGTQLRGTASTISGLRQFSSNFANLFYNASSSLEGISTLMQNLADGLTMYGRLIDNQRPDPFYAPIVSVPVPIVVVRWPWLSYALVLQCAGLIFLFLTISATQRLHVRPWKENRTALMLADLDESLRLLARGGLSTRTGLDERVGEVNVRLEFDGKDGIAFRRVYDKPSDQGVKMSRITDQIPPAPYPSRF